MGDVTGISWTDHTFNPWIGCTSVSPACDRCYARTLVNGRMGGDFDARRRTVPGNWAKPLRWNRAAAIAGRRARVFCASLADVFDNQVPCEWRRDLFDVIRATPWLDWQLLTKRPQNIAKMLPGDWGGGWPNVWLGTTTEDQTEAARRIPHLLANPAAVHFLSVEPMLERVDLERWIGDVDWIICGGESGKDARPMAAVWARELRNQSQAAGIPFFFKQWGSRFPGDQLDGCQHHAFPEPAKPCA